MTGFVGGAVTGRPLQQLADGMYHEPWYEHEFFEGGTHGIGFAHHGDRDPLGHTTWQGDGRMGIVYGGIPDHDRPAEVFDRLLDAPATLADLDGSFAVVCLDTRGETDRVLVATDKLGTRPCYYVEDRALFGSSLSTLLPELDDPIVDEQAVSDMLLLGNLWGDRTLVDEVKALPPATVLEYSEGEVRTERYWKPDFESAPRRGYIPELKTRYREAVDEASSTFGDTAGLWLSGGLDSRTLADGLARNAGRTFDSLVAYTYDANPRGGGNPAIARRVAAQLGVEVEELVMTPDRFLDVFETSVDLTDGMLRWSSLLNLSTIFNLDGEPANVLLEASGQGELIGQHPRRYNFVEHDSAVEGLVRSEQMVDTDTVQSLLAIDADPLRTFKETVAESDETTQRGRMLDVHYTNYYSRMTLASNTVPRSQAGTRVPFVNKDFLEHTAALPQAYRMGTFPLTGGSIPYGMTRPKHELARELDNGLDRIPYERTGLGPRRPFLAHLAGFVVKTGTARLRSKVAYGGAHEPDIWYREHEGLRERIDDLLRGACDRPWFDADEIRRLRREHLRGEANHMTTSLAAITTLECWFQRHLD
ncbi:asparagine synthase-related protein [Halococcus salsus]|uniref:asparagine synthase-related protein n=1 Tax=Halococcus salsus TaxID=2162894 RepID=UPI00135C54CD|nr:asparagine synthase-related protein [Halococcus salsus]